MDSCFNSMDLKLKIIWKLKWIDDFILFKKNYYFGTEKVPWCTFVPGFIIIFQFQVRVLSLSLFFPRLVGDYYMQRQFPTLHSQRIGKKALDKVILSNKSVLPAANIVQIITQSIRKNKSDYGGKLETYIIIILSLLLFMRTIII